VTWSPQFDGWNATVKPPDIDKEHTRTHEWRFHERTHEWELSVPVSTYEYCVNCHRVHEYGTYIVDPIQRSMLTDLRDRFDRFADRQGLDDRSLVTAVTRFVQSIPYSRDIDDTGHLAYPKYPAETFLHEQGDCEDCTVLLGALLDGLGFDVAVIVFPDAHHMVLGVALDSDAGAYVDHGGVRYHTIETTDVGWDVGELPDDYQGERAEVQLPEQTSVLVHEWEAVPRATSEGVVDVTAKVTNVGEAAAEPLTVQIEFENRDRDVVAGRQLNSPGESLGPGNTERYECRLRLPTSRDLRGRLTLAIERTVHDRSESEWH